MRLSLGAFALVLLVTGAAAFLLSCGQQRTRAAPMTASTPSAVLGSAPDTAPGAPTGTPSASEIFAVVKPGGSPTQVLVAPAAEHQPGGPETLVPVNIKPYRPLPLAPGAVIRITAPLYPDPLADWVKGAQVTPEQFNTDARQAEARYGPLPDRAHMFHITLDAQGRVTRMLHYFSP
jgi:hypothetical protein